MRLIASLGVLCSSLLLGLPAPSQPEPLWDGEAPGARGKEPHDIPTLTAYLAETTPHPAPAIVICPGGGYGGLAPHEGRDYALFLNQHGIRCFVLKYRLGSHGYRHPVMLQDAARAVRLVRSKAVAWNIDPTRVGIMGSSAGGHLASTLLTHFDAGQSNATDPVDRESSRPDLGILCYPVITMGPNTHEGSKQNLLGRQPSPKWVDELSNEKQVSAETPPCFLFHTWEDPGVKLENALEFASALRRHGVPFDLHVYEKGRHGIGLGDKPPFDNAHPWSADLVFWLKTRGFIQEPAAPSN